MQTPAWSWSESHNPRGRTTSRLLPGDVQSTTTSSRPFHADWKLPQVTRLGPSWMTPSCRTLVTGPGGAGGGGADTDPPPPPHAASSTASRTASFLMRISLIPSLFIQSTVRLSAGLRGLPLDLAAPESFAESQPLPYPVLMSETYFQKGFNLKAVVGPVLAESYHSSVVDRLKALG